MARILLVEDTEDNRALARFLLQAVGHVVVEATTGNEALAVVGPFDLVLMDLSLPGMDGFEAAGRLREAGCAAPIVAVTAHAMAGDRERVLEAGFAGYLAKPLDVARFASQVAAFL